MPRPTRTARHKLNASHLHGALLIAGVFGAASGSWTVFLVATGILVATSVIDGSLRI
jgi:hypothetical protein